MISSTVEQFNLVVFSHSGNNSVVSELAAAALVMFTGIFAGDQVPVVLSVIRAQSL